MNRLRPLLLALLLAPAAVPGGEPFQVRRSTIDGGGGEAAVEGSAVTATLGQPDAADVSVSASFSLRGGFWVAGPAPDCVFRDGFEEPPVGCPP